MIMPKALDFFQVDQFARVAEIPAKMVTAEVLARVRRLDGAATWKYLD